MKLLRSACKVGAGLVFGLLLVEGGFRLRDHGAFPHLNVYVPDAKLGVRLRPGSTEKISFSGNPVTSVRINAAGYRGADWPAHADGEIFVVGDSQAFGLGVEEAEDFASQLGATLGRPVADAAVPTYGPAEYDAVLAEELPHRKPKTVIYTINLANDLFEASHDNPTRHAVWDGWAVRKETAPVDPGSFPGRALLFRDSHLFFAARGAWFRFRGDDENGAVPSEGSWRDLASAGESLAKEELAQRSAHEADRKRREAALVAARTEIRKLDAQLGEAIEKTMGDGGESDYGAGTLRAAKANPGDIVRVSYGEGSQPVPLIAEQIKEAATARKAFEDKLRQTHDAPTLTALARRDQLDDTTKQLYADPDETVRSRSPLRPHLERAKAICDANGAELVVLVLPLDVQVSATEWAKYHAAPIDLSQTRVLADDVLTMAEQLGARTVDAWPALAATEPGAFLDGDLHMTPRGHAAVALAIAKVLKNPPRAIAKLPSLPLGRTPVPAPDAWRAALPLPSEYGSVWSDLRRTGCVADQVHEWLRVRCKGGTMRSDERSSSTQLVLNTDVGSTLVTALIEGKGFGVHVFDGARAYAVYGQWSLGEPNPELHAYKHQPKNAVAPTPSEAERALCACHREATGAADCSELYGSGDADCARTYAGDCRSQLRCARGDRSAPPSCEPPKALTGVELRCVAPAPDRGAEALLGKGDVTPR